MNLVIEEKEIAKLFKITVAKDEVRLKHPRDMDPSMKDRLIKFTKYVAFKIYEDFKYSMRGYVEINAEGYFFIRMENNAKNDHPSFSEYNNAI